MYTLARDFPMANRVGCEGFFPPKSKHSAIRHGTSMNYYIPAMLKVTPPPLSLSLSVYALDIGAFIRVKGNT